MKLFVSLQYPYLQGDLSPILDDIEYQVMLVVTSDKIREGFKKKKSKTWDIVPTGGEGVRHLELSVPTSLSDLIQKIDLNCLVSPRLKKIFSTRNCNKKRLFYL